MVERMADDLVVSLSADTMGFIRDMRQSANAMKAMGEQGQRTNSLLSRMNWGMAASGLAIGFQDAASVLSNNGTFGMALNAAGNNLIQVAAMAHPVAGAVSAIVIAGMQLAPMFSTAAAEAKKLKVEAEATKKSIEGMVSAHLGGIGSASNVKDQREAFAKETQMRQQIKEAQDRVAAANEMNPGNDPIQKSIRDNVIKGEMQKLTQLQVTLQGFLKSTRNLPLVAPGLTDAELPIVAQANDAVTQAKILRKEMTEIDAQMLKLHMTPGIRPEFIKQLRDGLTDLKEAQEEAAMEIKANDIWKGVKDAENKWQNEIQLFVPKKEDPSKLLNTPQLSAALVKGSIEEEAFRNRREAENRLQQFFRQQFDRTIRELKPPEPPPEIVVGGGH